MASTLPICGLSITRREFVESGRLYHTYLVNGVFDRKKSGEARTCALCAIDDRGERLVRIYCLRSQADSELRAYEALRNREIDVMTSRLSANLIPLNDATTYRRDLATTKTRRYLILPILSHEQVAP